MRSSPRTSHASQPRWHAPCRRPRFSFGSAAAMRSASRRRRPFFSANVNAGPAAPLATPQATPANATHGANGRLCASAKRAAPPRGPARGKKTPAPARLSPGPKACPRLRGAQRSAPRLPRPQQTRALLRSRRGTATTARRTRAQPQPAPRTPTPSVPAKSARGDRGGPAQPSPTRNPRQPPRAPHASGGNRAGTPRNQGPNTTG